MMKRLMHIHTNYSPLISVRSSSIQTYQKSTYILKQRNSSIQAKFYRALNMSRTPIKKKEQEQSLYSSSFQGRNSFKKRAHLQNQNFNPRLYVTNSLNQEDVLLIKEAFDHHDTNGTGILTPNDLKIALLHENFHASKQTVYSIIAEFDEECLGGLNFASFIRIIGSNPCENESKHELKKIFRKYDKDNKGYISEENLIEVFRACGEVLSREEMRQIFASIDKNGNGKIDFETFAEVMHHPDSIC